MHRETSARGVCVVIAAHDARDTIAAAVTSALRSALVAKCIVVDDASGDETAAVVERLARDDPRVALVARSVRGGPSRARDDGLAAVREPRVCFLDADDELADGGLAALSDALDRTRGALGALGRFEAVDAAGASADVGEWSDAQLRPVVRRHGQLVESPEGLTPEALVTRLISPPPGAWLLDATAVRAVGGFNPDARRSEDLELLVRLAEAGPLVTTDATVLHYLRHDRQRSAATARRRYGRGHTLWLMLRAAPGPRATRGLAHGIGAYHLELWARRWHAGPLRMRAMALRNLAAALIAWPAGLVASVLPRRVPPPLTPTSEGLWNSSG